MIKIVASSLVREACIEQYHALAKELVEKSQAEPGNICYTLNQSTSDPRVHSFLESWKDQAAIDAHNASEHFQRIVPQLAALREETQTVEFYTEVEY
ncbi:MAG: antibiotic biosynthesis monooxygenase [Oscillospiraceae bacterium]|nr:antibiotic biosynthesis monooxygenase [Oscillospiraceae bacterium]